MAAMPSVAPKVGASMSIFGSFGVRKTLLFSGVIVAGLLLVIGLHSKEDIAITDSNHFKEGNKQPIDHTGKDGKNLTNVSLSSAKHQRELDPSWRQAYEPLSSAEAIEYGVVVDQIKKFYSIGSMDKESLQQFRGIVYKLRDRGLAHLGNILLKIDGNSSLKNAAEAENILDIIDSLSYFAKAKDPLALQIIEDLAKRPIEWNEDGKMNEPLVNVLTLQMFEVFSKYEPEKALSYIRSDLNPKIVAPYLYYLKLGMRRSGKTDEAIDKMVSSI